MQLLVPIRPPLEDQSRSEIQSDAEHQAGGGKVIDNERDTSGRHDRNDRCNEPATDHPDRTSQFRITLST